jgi:hypothetical protein
MSYSYQTDSHRGPQMITQPTTQPHVGAAPGARAHAAGMQGSAQQYYNPYGDDAYHYYQAAEYGYPSASTPAAGGVGSWFDFSNTRYLKGFALGAGVTLLLTNSSVQKALLRGAVKLWSFFEGGVEEVKEQFRDVKAEMSQEE